LIDIGVLQRRVSGRMKFKSLSFTPTFRAPLLPTALPFARSRQSTSMYRSYTEGRM
jgi:hypothetical protein